jgi:hypothetical protein
MQVESNPVSACEMTDLKRVEDCEDVLKCNRVVVHSDNTKYPSQTKNWQKKDHALHSVSLHT